MNLPHKYAGRSALSPQEAAEVLSLSTTTCYRRIMPHVYSGAIVSFKVGACRRIIVASLFAWVEQQIAPTAA